MKKYFLIFITVFTVSNNLKAQDGFENLLLANDNDRKQLFTAYLNPAMKGLIYGMNSGWYHTAKVHKPFGFDLAIGLNASIAPSKDEVFALSGLTSINQPLGSISSQTAMGSSSNPTTATVSTTVNVNGTPTPVTSTFEMPVGIKEDVPINAIPTPAIQFTLGLPKKFEASLRLVPKVGNDDVKGSLFGLGVKKEITSLLGPIKKTPFHLSVLAAYTTMNVDYSIDEIDNTTSEFKLNSFTAQAIASLNFPIINIYGGLGYSSGSSTLKMLGEYELEYDGNTVADPIVDPINSKFKANSFNATAGLRLSLGFFKIFGSYTLQEYNTANLGIAISIR